MKDAEINSDNLNKPPPIDAINRPDRKVLCDGLAFRDLPEAIAYCDGLLNANPKNVSAWGQKGIFLRFLGKAAESIDCFDKIMELDPHCAGRWWNAMAGLLYAADCPRDAIACYDKAISLDPADVDSIEARHRAILASAPPEAAAQHNRGAELHRSNRLEEALTCFEKAIELNPRFAEAWNGKAAVLDGLGRQAEALVCLTKAVEFYPRFTGAWNNKALLEERLGKDAAEAESLRTYRRLARGVPGQEKTFVSAQLRLNALEGKPFSNGVVGRMARHDTEFLIYRAFGKSSYVLNEARNRCWYIPTSGNSNTSRMTGGFVLELEPARYMRFPFDEATYVGLSGSMLYIRPGELHRALLFEASEAQDISLGATIAQEPHMSAKRSWLGTVHLIVGEHSISLHSKNVFGYGVTIKHGDDVCYLLVAKHVFRDGNFIDVTRHARSCTVDFFRKGFGRWGLCIDSCDCVPWTRS